MSEHYTPDTPITDVYLPWATRDAIVQDVIANDMATAFADREPRTIADDVKAHAVKLATLRTELTMRDDKIKAARRGFEETIADELRTLEALKREVEAEESALRGLALVAHETSGAKKVCAGVEVVVSKEYAIDEDAALQWAKVTKMCLLPESVDLKAIKKMATVTELPFVSVTERPSVRIASDLLAALSKEAA